MWRVLVIAGVLVLAVGCGAAPQDVRGGQQGRFASSPTSKPWVRARARRCEEMLPLLEEAAGDHGIDSGLLVGIVDVESSFRPAVVSSAGAVGLMQVMPSNGRNLSCGDLSEPVSNIACGIRVLKGFLRYYDGDLIFALSGYNAGFARPNRARREGRLPSNHGYVEKVLAARASYLRRGCGT